MLVAGTGERRAFKIAPASMPKPAEPKISANSVKALRQNIPNGAQGAFITTCVFHRDAQTVANETGFARIGLIDGENLVDILAEHWDKIPVEFRDKLNLKLGLVLA